MMKYILAEDAQLTAAAAAAAAAVAAEEHRDHPFSTWCYFSLEVFSYSYFVGHSALQPPLSRRRHSDFAGARGGTAHLRPLATVLCVCKFKKKTGTVSAFKWFQTSPTFATHYSTVGLVAPGL